MSQLLPDTLALPATAHAPATPSLVAPEWTDGARQALFTQWLAQISAGHGLVVSSLVLASADASFRRYFRIARSTGESLIIMDAPPAKEDSQPFVTVAGLMADAGVRAPKVLAWDAANGFMLLSDLGRQTMLEVLNRDDAGANLPLYMDAVEKLIRWQSISKPAVLPPYNDALLRRELALFPDWYIAKHKQQVLDNKAATTLAQAFDIIVANNLSAASVFVHRDFMPRNLMVSPQGLGVLDFQDAVYGPITYDIACLMRDAFISWDEAFVLDVTVRYWQQARKAGLPVDADFGAFYRAVEWMGLQRHLKVAGIFARLTLRDGKPQYLADAPRFIAYIRSTCSRYRELGPLLRLVDAIEGISTPSGFAFGRV